MKDIRDIDIAGKRVLVRVDLNLPVHKGQILDFSRIALIKNTIEFLKSKSAKIILISHFGRPNGFYHEDMSLDFIVPVLIEQLGIKVEFGGRVTDLDAIEKTHAIEDASILLFENLRFYQEEESNDIHFAKRLASLGDYYINEAFSCSHRAHASIDVITKYIPAYPGFSLLEDIEALDMVLNTRGKRVVCIIGGKKISTKFPLLNNLSEICNNVIIAGAMANTIYASTGFFMSSSYFEKNLSVAVKKFYKKNETKVVLPEDFVCVDSDGKVFVHQYYEMPDDRMALDVGADSIKKFKDVLKQADIILWNGPLGYYENEQFNKATIEIATYISKLTEMSGIKSIIGGGDTIAAISKAGKLNFTHISTAGGAFLEYCEGKELPGIKALKRNQNTGRVA